MRIRCFITVIFLTCGCNCSGETAEAAETSVATTIASNPTEASSTSVETAIDAAVSGTLTNQIDTAINVMEVMKNDVTDLAATHQTAVEKIQKAKTPEELMKAKIDTSIKVLEILKDDIAEFERLQKQKEKNEDKRRTGQ